MASSDHILTIGTFEKHSLCVLAISWEQCSLYKYTPPVLLPLTVGKVDTRRIRGQCLFTCQVETCCVPTTGFVVSKQTGDVCGQSVPFGTSERPSTPAMGTRSQCPGRYLWQVQRSTYVCQIKYASEQYDSHSHGFVFNVKLLLAYFSDTPVAGSI